VCVARCLDNPTALRHPTVPHTTTHSLAVIADSIPSSHHSTRTLSRTHSRALCCLSSLSPPLAGGDGSGGAWSSPCSSSSVSGAGTEVFEGVPLFEEAFEGGLELDFGLMEVPGGVHGGVELPVPIACPW